MFNTVDSPKYEGRLIELAKQDLDTAQDNLIRARNAARGRDANAQWGQGIQTLAQIISGYETWVKQAQDTLAEARRKA